MAAGIYIQLDVDYFDDDKVIAVGPLSETLFVRSMAFAKRNLTDGVLKSSQLVVIARGLKNPNRLATKLVEVGLWTEIDGGWLITSYLKRNKSAAEINLVRARRQAASIEANHRRWHVGKDGKPSPSCALCGSQIGSRIGSDDRSVVGSDSEITRTPTETETETETETQLEPHLPTSSTGPVDNSTSEERTNRIIDAIVTHRCAGKQLTNAAAYRAKVRVDVARDHRAVIARLATQYPDAPDDVIGNAAETGDARTLAAYRTPTPIEEPDVRLSREERQQVLAENRATP